MHRLADYALMMTVFDSITHRVGSTIERLPEEDRELLKTLKSGDIVDVRPIMDHGHKIHRRPYPKD